MHKSRPNGLYLYCPSHCLLSRHLPIFKNPSYPKVGNSAVTIWSWAKGGQHLSMTALVNVELTVTEHMQRDNHS